VIKYNRHRAEKHGWMGNQSPNGVPQGNMPDLIPVAWRPTAPHCPPELIASALGIPESLPPAPEA